MKRGYSKRAYRKQDYYARKRRAGPMRAHPWKRRSYRVSKATIAVERKFQDYLYGFGATPIELTDTWTAVVAHPFQIGQNDTESGRDGRQCIIDSFHIRGHILIPSETGTEGDGELIDKFNNIRIAAVLDRSNQYEGTVENKIAQIWQTPKLGATTPSGSWFHCMRNLDNSRRFKVLMDKVIRCPTITVFPIGGTSIDEAAPPPNQTMTYDCRTLPRTIPFQFHFKFRKGLKVNYNGTTGALSEIADYSFHMFAIGQAPDDGAADLNPVFKCQTRVRFRG